MSSSRVVPGGSIGSSCWGLGGMESKQLRVRISDETSGLLSEIQIHHKNNDLPGSLESVLAESIKHLHHSLFPVDSDDWEETR